MKKAQIATAVAVGYALGRTRRMKLALMAGGVLLGRRAKSPTDLLAKAGGAVPTGLRDRLVDAARSAAVSAASNKIDSLGDDLSDRAAKIRSSQDESEEPPQEEAEEQESAEEPQAAEAPQAAEEPQESGAGSGDSARPRAPRTPSAPRKPRSASTRKAGGNDD